MRNLVLVLGDQLNHDSPAFDGFDNNDDAVWMAEVQEETNYVWCHKQRIALFLSAMRYFRNELERKGREVCYHQLQRQAKDDHGTSFAEVLSRNVKDLQPEKLIVVQPGDHRVQQQLKKTADKSGLELEIRKDTHFYCDLEDFKDYAANHKGLLQEYFYREQRRKHDVLMQHNGEPEGGQWNFDHDNRDAFGNDGPPKIPPPKTSRTDATVQEVLELVEHRFSDHPGQLKQFDLPLTRRQALSFLDNFISHILPQFGRWEDAMWADEPFLFHSRLSAPLNLKLLDPRECVDAAVDAYRSGNAPLNSVEGFVRQILGWREYIRGIYWLKMPDYQDRNYFDHQRSLPSFFWDGQTDMNCVQQSMQHVLNHGYSHHIHRLMVLGNFAQLWGVHPYEFHEWHMAMYLDAVDWVSLPNALGMSQYADGGIVGTKPYCSSGNYINKMSNFCSGCKFDHRRRTGGDACPFTTLYWEFMDRHHDLLKDNSRMKFAVKNLEKLKGKPGELEAIRERARQLRDRWEEPQPGE